MQLFDFVYLFFVGLHFYLNGFDDRRTNKEYMTAAMTPFVLMAFSSIENTAISKWHTLMVLFTISEFVVTLVFGFNLPLMAICMTLAHLSNLAGYHRRLYWFTLIPPAFFQLMVSAMAFPLERFLWKPLEMSILTVFGLVLTLAWASSISRLHYGKEDAEQEGALVMTFGYLLIAFADGVVAVHHYYKRVPYPEAFQLLPFYLGMLLIMIAHRLIHTAPSLPPTSTEQTKKTD